MPAIENTDPILIDQNDDSEPEDVPFTKSKQDTIDNLQKIRDQVFWSII
jgi:hypothetical protein